MWVGDNCHTYDRHNYKAQLECGIGNNYQVLDTVLNSTFNLLYHPYIQGAVYTPEEIAEQYIPDEYILQTKNWNCLQRFVYNSYYNIKLRSLAVSKSSAALVVAVTLLSLGN
jgi:hypothetical protein|tara:strand:+ start:1004 stop:1339 length:336 start_codon:yes stop_codon:yes gene_type:complete